MKFMYTNNGNSSDITFESVLKSTREALALRPTDVPDIYVMTTKAFWKLRDELEDREYPGPLPFSQLFMCGIPIEHYATLREVHERCLELQRSGKRVALACE